MSHPGGYLLRVNQDDEFGISGLSSCAGICITWEEFKPFNWNTQMLRNVYCKLPARLHQVPEVFESNVPSGQLLSVFSWGRFQNAQLSCNRACAKLSFPNLSSPMYAYPYLALNSFPCFLSKRLFLILESYLLLGGSWQAVRIGDLELFRAVADKNANVFYTNKTHNLIVRLRHNVIRTGLRNISISYSCISLRDVALKLHLDSATAVADAESIVTKAIWDGGIDASVDHSKGWMKSKATGDIYSTQEPQQAFHSRIAFFLNTHNEAVKALRFPPYAHKKELESSEKQRECQQQELELAKRIAEQDDDEF
ncbi:unnamed protein product [Sphagnum balticum]